MALRPIFAFKLIVEGDEHNGSPAWASSYCVTWSESDGVPPPAASESMSHEPTRTMSLPHVGAKVVRPFDQFSLTSIG